MCADSAASLSQPGIERVFFTGTPAVFVRFSGCNLKCSFCDTQHEEGVWMSDEEILAEVAKYPAVTLRNRINVCRA